MNAPITETIELEGGGTLTLTRFDGEPVVRCAHEKAGTRISFGLTPADVRELNHATVSLSLAVKVRP